MTIKLKGVEMGHTPGPWKIHSGDIAIVLGADGEPLADTHGIESAYFHVKRDQKERHANASLIASATDLLEACKEVIPALGALEFYIEQIGIESIKHAGLQDVAELKDKVYKAILRSKGR